MMECFFSTVYYGRTELFEGLRYGKVKIQESNYYMNMVTNMTFSYFDCGSGYGIIDETERFYHGFVLGLIAQLSDDFYITSNRKVELDDMI